jgi:hypothetical protein
VSGGGGPSPRTGSPITAVAWCWIVHGSLLVMNGILVPLMSDLVRQEDWAESMRMLGAGALVDQTRALCAALEPLAWLMVLAGTVPAIIGAVALRLGTRCAWLLHLLAAIHLVLIPWASWRMHSLLLGGSPTGASAILGEALAIILTEAIVVAAIVVVERARRREAGTRAETPPP